MRHLRKPAWRGAVGIALASVGVPAIAQPSPLDSTTAKTIDLEATAAMDRMNATLRGMTDLALESDFTTEQVLTSGQKLQYGGTLSAVAHRPTGLKMVIASDTQHREFYYDGQSLTIVAPTLKYYTSVPAASTIGQMLHNAQYQLGIEFPLADLFTWGTNQLIRSRVMEGYVVRPETITGRSCMHYAFRQQRVDWQIWIEDGTNLPCKLVITNTTDPSMPQYSAVLKWRDPGAIDPATFHYRPHDGVTRIAIADVQGKLEGAGK